MALVQEWAMSPDSEPQRLQALHSYRVLDTPSERVYDDLTQLAAQLLDMPIVLVTLLDENRQWFKSRVGLDLTQTPRSIAFCDVAIRTPGITVIPDARLDARFAHNPLVLGEPGIRFYASAPLVTPEGDAVGTLCVIDREPRVLSEAQCATLIALSNQVMTQLNLHKRNLALSQALAELATERDQLHQQTLALQASEERLALVLRGANEGWWDWDLATDQRYYSPRGWLMLGYQPDELPYDDALFVRLTHPDDRAQLSHKLSTAIRSQDAFFVVEIRLRHRAGHFITVRSSNFILRDAKGWAVRLSGTNTDLTDRKNAERAEKARQASQDSYELLFTNSMDAVLQTIPDGSVVDANPAACAMLGWSRDELCSRERAQLLDLSDPRLSALLTERSRSGRAQGELTMIRANGERFPVEISSALYRDDQGATLASVVFRDITERKQAEAAMHQLAYFDALTGLPNRRLLIDRTLHALAAAQRAGQVGALVFIDLDNFKQINDAQGHAVGDQLLVQVAQRLSGLLRAQDTVARLGGDEFVVLACDLGQQVETAARAAMNLAQKIREALEQPYTIQGHVYSSTGSLGITLFPKEGEKVDDLLREADTAMYQAKESGRNRITFYESAMQADVQNRLALEQDLKKAVAAEQLEVYVQTQVEASGAVGGELLLRWHHPVRGAVPPTHFIPVAEESGLILRLGDWVVRQACEALATLHAAGRPLTLSVNVSPRQFRQDDFVARIQGILAATGAPASGLILEVTEGLLIKNWEDTAARMTELVNLGVRFSIDDFGTGYSSLAYLKKLPLFELKIDKSFVQDTPGDPNDTAIVRSILSVAQHLKLRVVAEGVETRAQADFLTLSQCNCLQGYLFARPVPMAQWLAEQLGDVPRRQPEALAASVSD